MVCKDLYHLSPVVGCIVKKRPSLTLYNHIRFVIDMGIQVQCIPPFGMGIETHPRKNELIDFQPMKKKRTVTTYRQHHPSEKPTPIQTGAAVQPLGTFNLTTHSHTYEIYSPADLDST